MKLLSKLAVAALIFGGSTFLTAPRAEAGVNFGFAVGGPRWGVAVGHTPAYRYYGPRYYAPSRRVVVRSAPVYRRKTVVYGSRRSGVVVRKNVRRPYVGRRVAVW